MQKGSSIRKKPLQFSGEYANIHLDIEKSCDWAALYWERIFRESGMVGSAHVQCRAFSHEPPPEIPVGRAGWFR